MRYIIYFLSLIPTASAIGQSSNPYSPNFAAIVVNDINISSPWYQSVFGMTLKSESDMASGLKQIVLSSALMEVELLEFSGSLSRSSILVGHVAGAQVQGLFKIGFTVSDMDKMLSHLKAVNVPVPRIYTDTQTRKRNFLITDPDGNYIQFFE